MDGEKIYDYKIKSYSIYELYKLLSPILDELYKDYVNIIDGSKLREISLNVIKECVINFDINNGIPFQKYFKNKMNNYFKNYIKSLLKNKKQKTNLVLQYINTNINFINSYELAIEEIKKIINFFLEFDYKPSFNICQKIVNGEKVNNLLKIITERNINLIEDGNIEQIFDDELFISLVEIYCSINGISERYDIDIDNDFTDIDSKLEINKILIYEIEKYPLLTREQEVELFEKYANGDESAKEILINSNLKLVLSIARKLKNKYYSNKDLLDLFQDGSIGLMKAVDKFDVSKGYKLSTYATWWIKQEINRSIKKNYEIINCPEYIYSLKSKIGKTKVILESKLNRTPSISEISKELNIPDSVIERINNSIPKVVSLNDPINNEEDSDELENFIPSNNESVEETADKLFFKEDVIRYIDTSNLSDIEKDIIKSSYGINCDKETFEVIGKRYNLTKQRIEQISKKALKKLKESNYKENLKVYLNKPVEVNKQKNKPKEKILTKNSLIEEITKRIDDDKLGLMEQNVLKGVYGIKMDKKSFAEIGEVFKLPKERIMQIHVEALGKLGLSKFIYSNRLNNLKSDGVNLISNKEKIEIESCRGEKNMAGKSESIYITLGCTKEEFDTIYPTMSEYDKYVLKLKCSNGDLEHPISSEEWKSNSKFKNYFYRTFSKNFNEKLMELRNNSDEKLITTKQNEINKTSDNLELSMKNYDKKEEDNYLKFIRTFKLESLDGIIKSLSPLDSTIGYLRSGLINGTYYTREELSHFLKIDISYIIRVEKKILVLIKKQFDGLIEEAMKCNYDKEKIRR